MAGHFPFLSQNWLWRMLSLIPGSWQRRQNPWCGCYALYKGQEDSYWWDSRQECCGFILFTSPQHSWLPSTAGWPAGGNGQADMSFSLWSPVMPQYDLLKGHSPDYPGKYMLCAHYTQILGCWVEWYLFYPVRVYPKIREIIANQTSQTLLHPPIGAGASPEPSVWVQAEGPWSIPSWLPKIC